MYMKYQLKIKGFTIVELLVVVAIISILTAIVTANLTQSKSKARDAKRVSDLSQISFVLEMVFDRCHKYPSSISNTDINDESKTCTGFPLSTFISVIPRDGENSYDYTVKNDQLDYVLRAKLENNNSVLLDDVDGSPLGSDCNDAENYYCIQPK